MNWIMRENQPLVNLDHVASLSLRKIDGYPDVEVVFLLPGGQEVVWETSGFDEAEGVLFFIQQQVSPHEISSKKA